MNKIDFVKIFLLSIISIFLSCSSENDSTSSNTYKWSCKLNGVLYEYESNTPMNGGYYYNYDSVGAMVLSGDGIVINITYPTVSTGIFNFNTNNHSTSNRFYLGNPSPCPNGLGNCEYSGNGIRVNISSLSNDRFSTFPSNPGKVIGTFYGQVKKSDGTTIEITEGMFEIVRD